MLTFLELYQTLLGFVFFKLYTDAGLVYPPPSDTNKEETAAGIGALSIQETVQNISSLVSGGKTIESFNKSISGKTVRQTIKSISAESGDEHADLPHIDATIPNDTDEEFVPQPSTTDPHATVAIPTLQYLAVLPQSVPTSLFSAYTFFLSRETSRPILEFLVRSFGGRIGWPASLGSGSPYDETEPSITHIIIDRPVVVNPNESSEERERRLKRKWVQPQWVVDCINKSKILLEGPYAQGQTLPPHLSPFGEHEGAYDPTAELDDALLAEDESEDEDVQNEADEEENAGDIAIGAAISAVSADPAALRAAELAAEAAGVDYGTFEKEVRKSQREATKTAGRGDVDGEHDMNKMMMSNKQKKLYEKMKYSNTKRAKEVRMRCPLF
jgi:pescadillo